ncbi:hypothetical protein CSOJ01_04620 [Colletotrichum sojae]|uniref:Uncharacterized protein n=1 Tax=Colletotrichum sojae TaxID=2175907 RepID=A0A8H6MZ07_9PEZI|nr:hypothetical protein CSOJ01_04620 [Colletotrichum sojae]
MPILSSPKLVEVPESQGLAVRVVAHDWSLVLAGLQTSTNPSSNACRRFRHASLLSNKTSDSRVDRKASKQSLRKYRIEPVACVRSEPAQRDSGRGVVRRWSVTSQPASTWRDMQHAPQPNPVVPAPLCVSVRSIAANLRAEDSIQGVQPYRGKGWKEALVRRRENDILEAETVTHRASSMDVHRLTGSPSTTYLSPGGGSM